MSAFEEFRSTGEPGREFMQLVRRVFTAILRARFGGDWSPEEPDDLVQEFFASQQRLAHLYLEATGEQSLRRLVHRAAENVLADRARQWPRGRLARSIHRDLDNDARFSYVTGQGAGAIWTLDGYPDVCVNDDEDSLACAAWEVEVERVEWDGPAGRQGPLATESSRVALLERLIEAAGGGLTVSRMTNVAARRLLLTEPDEATDVGALEVADHRLASAPEQQAQVLETAEALWTDLDERERTVAAVLDLPAREAASRLGMSKSTVARLQQAVRNRLSGQIPHPAERADVLAALIDRAAS